MILMERMQKTIDGRYYNELQVVNVRLVREPSIISEKPIKSAGDASRLIQELISQFDREVFCVLNLASDGAPISMNIVSIGTLDTALVSPREVFKSSILSNAASFIAFHCHPSGNPRPSLDDAITTHKLKEVGEILDIRMLDHIIVACGSEKTFSFRSEGLLDGSDVIKAYDKFKSREEWER